SQMKKVPIAPRLDSHYTHKPKYITTNSAFPQLQTLFLRVANEVHKKLKPIDKLILILSTIGHDLDHPGFNNTYQINAATDLAIIYNDISPLENHHAAVLFTLLTNDETNILANVSDAVYRDARKNIIRCILATDMAKHGEIMAAFKKSAENFNFDDAEHKSLLLQIIVKCSDISNE
ncbi:hypothetical protein HDU78_000712, partial [Chytriomyces hyalinus]